MAVQTVAGEKTDREKRETGPPEIIELGWNRPMLPFISTRLGAVLPAAAARIAALTELRATVFGTTYNPLSLRTGSKILKARLRGPSMLRYYGERMSGVAALNAQVPGLALRDVAEETRCAAARRATPLTVQTHRPRDETEARQGDTEEGYVRRARAIELIVCQDTEDEPR